MVAPQHREEPASIRVLALLDIFDPGAKRAERNLVLRLASDRARVTADALAMVYDKTVFHFVSTWCDARRGSISSASIVQRRAILG